MENLYWARLRSIGRRHGCIYSATARYHPHGQCKTTSWITVCLVQPLVILSIPGTLPSSGLRKCGRYRPTLHAQIWVYCLSHELVPSRKFLLESTLAEPPLSSLRENHQPIPCSCHTRPLHATNRYASRHKENVSNDARVTHGSRMVC